MELRTQKQGGATISQREPSRAYGTGRVCGFPACTTQLSRYNPSRLCSVHEGVKPESVRQERAYCVFCGQAKSKASFPDAKIRMCRACAKKTSESGAHSVSALLACEHIGKLVDLGMSNRKIAHLANCGESTVASVRSGARTSLTSAVNDKILKVQLADPRCTR